MTFTEALANVGQAIDEALSGRVAAPAAAAKAEKKAPAKAPAKKKKAAAKPKADEPKPPSLDETRDALRRCIDVGDNDAATEILEPFGVKKVSEADPDDLAAIIAACEQYIDENAGDDNDPTA